MHKVKRAIQQLRQYLGRDQRGLALLDDIAGIANSLRQQVATASEQEASANRVAETAKANATQAQEKTKKIRSNLERERAQRKSREVEVTALTARIRELEAELADLTPPDVPLPEEDPKEVSTRQLSPLVKDARHWVGMVNSLRHTMRRAPGPLKILPITRLSRMYVYELTDIIDDFSGAECLKLGKFIAAMTMIGLDATIMAEENFSNLARREQRCVPDSVVKPFLKWFMAKNVQPATVEEEHILRAVSAVSEADPTKIWR